MFLPHLAAFKARLAASNARLVLASASPRRREILAAVFNNDTAIFEVVASNFEENLPHASFDSPGAYALATARGKAVDVARNLKTPGFIIAADTVVYEPTARQILEKPSDDEDAKRMLRLLSGKEHVVCTGVVVVTVDKDEKTTEEFSFVASTKVYFSDLDESTIAAYVSSGEPMGKAGGYAIQGLGRTLIHRVDGCYMNVVGFPAAEFSQHLAKYMARHTKSEEAKRRKIN